jgi:hypothetical protein
MWRTNVEIVATVLPANFSSPIVLTRDAIGFCNYSDMLPLGCSSNPDPSQAQFRDDDPQSGGSGGKVQDFVPAAFFHREFPKETQTIKLPQVQSKPKDFASQLCLRFVF